MTKDFGTCERQEGILIAQWIKNVYGNHKKEAAVVFPWSTNSSVPCYFYEK